MQSTQTRRSFLATLSSAGVVGLVRARDSYAARGTAGNYDRPPRENLWHLHRASVCRRRPAACRRLYRYPLRCNQSRNFQPPSRSRTARSTSRRITRRPMVISIDAGEPITIVGGEHVGCFEVFAREGIRSIADLKGKNVGVQSIGSSQHVFLSVMAAHVGLDPAKDIHWVTSTSPKPMELFADGKIDAFLGLPPEPQELRARNIGRVIVNSVLDRPWSQYFCCVLAAQSRVHSKISGRDQARAARHCQSRRSLRKRADARCAADRRCRVHASATIMRCRRSRKFRTHAGGNTIPRMRFASTRCGCAKQA